MGVGIRHANYGDFPLGLDNTSNPLFASPDTLREMVNVRWKIPNILKRRGGNERWGSIPNWGTNPTTCLGIVEGPNEDSVIAVLDDGVFYEVTSKTGNWTAISGATGYNTSAFWEFAKTKAAIGTEEEVLLDDCETADWTEGGEASAETLDSEIYKEGSKSLSLGKPGANGTDATYEKTLSSQYNGSSREFYMWFWIRSSVLKWERISKVIIYIGNDSNNYYYKEYARSELSSNWNKLGGNLPRDFTAVDDGTLDITKLGWLKIILRTPSNSAVIPHGNIFMDYWHFPSSSDIIKNVIIGTNGYNPIALYNTTTWDTNSVAEPGRAKYVIEFWNRILLANVTYEGVSYENRMYYSDLNDPTTYPVTSFLDFGSYEYITGMKQLGKDLYVFKPHQIYRIRYTGNAATPFIPEKVSDTVGAEPRTIQSTGVSLIFFCENQGVYSIGINGTAKKISDNVWSDVSTFTHSPVSAINRVKHHYYLWDRLGSDSNKPLIYDYGRDAWTQYEFANKFDCSCILNWDGQYNSCLLGWANGTTGVVVMPDTDSLVKDEGVSILLDDCETADWTEGGDATAETADATDFKGGTTALRLGKNGTATRSITYDKTLGATYDATGQGVYLWLKIAQAAYDVLNPSDSGAAVSVRFGNNSTNYYYKNYTKAELSVGWNLIGGIVADDFIPLDTGSLDITTLDYIMIGIVTEKAADTIAHGDLIMDWWQLTSPDEYYDTTIVTQPITWGDAVLKKRFREFAIAGKQGDGGIFIPSFSMELNPTFTKLGSTFSLSGTGIMSKIFKLPNVKARSMQLKFISTANDDDTAKDWEIYNLGVWVQMLGEQ